MKLGAGRSDKLLKLVANSSLFPFTSQRMDAATAALLESHDSTKSKSYAVMAASNNVPQSTLWHRAHGRRLRRREAEGQQYLTPSEEKALLSHLLRMSNNGFPIPVKFLRSLALIIARQRSSSFRVPSANKTIHPPGKNWARGFYKRHPKLKSRRVKQIGTDTTITSSMYYVINVVAVARVCWVKISAPTPKC